jgi:hypothetical protein
MFCQHLSEGFERQKREKKYKLSRKIGVPVEVPNWQHLDAGQKRYHFT